LASVFPFDKFNAVQTAVFPQAYGTDRNILICAPTGVGKTQILEIAICDMIKNSNRSRDQQARKPTAVYIGPVKALVQEKANGKGAKCLVLPHVCSRPECS
jgi:pre-mRNA-splicing helicase BRR2